jgi:hypothetical protein
MNLGGSMSRICYATMFPFNEPHPAHERRPETTKEQTMKPAEMIEPELPMPGEEPPRDAPGAARPKALGGLAEVRPAAFFLLAGS